MPEPIAGAYGYRHHCGGDIEITIDGTTTEGPISLNWEFGFGPTYADPEIEDIDVYDTPLVAACCGGPMDLESTNTSYTDSYYKNCLYDGVQQVCAGLPKWIERMADEAREDGKTIKANYLNGLAGDLNTAELQGICIETLYETDVPVAQTSNRTWNFVADLIADIDLRIDSLNIYEIDYPAPPATCNSVLDNDEYVLPVLTALAAGASMDNLFLSSGSGSLTDNDSITETISPNMSSAMSIATWSGSGAIEVRTLALFGGSETVVVDSVPVSVDDWNMRLIKPVSAVSSSTTFTFDPGTVTFAAGATWEGTSITLVGSNVDDLVLTPLTGGGWRVSDLKVEYSYGGSRWTYTISQMDFL